jgi:hypothetical protein
MSRSSVLLKKSLIFTHRWLGVSLCVLFLLWFSSGIVMMYSDFPSVSAEDRLERSPPLDVSKIRASPAQAFAKLKTQQPPREVRLNTFDGRPRSSAKLESSSSIDLGSFLSRGNLAQQRSALPGCERPAQTLPGWRSARSTEPENCVLQSSLLASRPANRLGHHLTPIAAPELRPR